MRRVNQQPSGEPEVGYEGREQQQPGDQAVVSRVEEEQTGVGDVTDTSNKHGHTKVARENSPHADAGSEHEHVHTSEDLLEVVSVLVNQQQKVGKLGADRGHVVGVEVLLEGFVEWTAGVQQKTSSYQEYDVGSVDGLLNNLEGADGHSSGGVDTGTNHDETEGDSNHDVDDANNQFQEDSKLEIKHTLRDLVGGFFGLLPLNQDPADSDGGVDGTEDGDDRENTGGQGSPSKALSPFLELLALILVLGFGIRHFNKLILGRHGDDLLL